MGAANPFPYPAQSLRLHDYAGTLDSLYPRPLSHAHAWPPIQVTYLAQYLSALGCRAVIEEEHYIDRDYIEDLSLYYGRSLRNYPNHCRRLHFFSRAIGEAEWRELLSHARREYETVRNELNQCYLGFTVIRPLPGRPVGRTVLCSAGPQSTDGLRREFESLRSYTIHIAGIELQVTGIAFQQQDQGVSACATTAVWSAIHGVAVREHQRVPTPAELTQAASRYLLMNGRTLPSEGLAIQQICEAIRASDLAPALLPASSVSVDRGALDAYLRSGFPAVIAVLPYQATGGVEGHAVCALGAKIGEIEPQADPSLNYRDGATALKAIYVHDDRIGPYAIARLLSLTDQHGRVRTGFDLKWAGARPTDEGRYLLHSIVVPVPNKVRLSVARLRIVGQLVGQALGTAFPDFNRTTTVRCRYARAVDYVRELFSATVSDRGLERLTSGTAMSRYIGVVEVTALDSTLADVILDCTEAVEHPSIIAVVNRSGLPRAGVAVLEELAKLLGTTLIQ